MSPVAPGTFGAHLKALREAAGFTQEELATIAGLSVHAVSALERAGYNYRSCAARLGCSVAKLQTIIGGGDRA